MMLKLYPSFFRYSDEQEKELQTSKAKQQAKKQTSKAAGSPDSGRTFTPPH